ncbi:MAG: PDZ domain-containing protein [Bacteroidota bacterium]|nr:PDZ domain-containing protein [Bacteroidota bacterium]
MSRLYVLLFIAIFQLQGVFAQLNAGLFRFPDVSQAQIVFCYGNDLWLMPKEGGLAIKLSSPAGVESFPKFSPDGSKIAFSGNYDGNTDIYLIPVIGGVPQRLTQHGMSDRIVDWHPDGKRILFASGRESEKERYNQFYTISSNGGAADKLPFAYGEFGSYSQDASQMAVVFRSEVFRTWKRYRGGDVADIYIYDFQKNTSRNISSEINASEELPMWQGNSIYFLSDNGPENRMNLWKYDLNNKQRKQLTNYKDFDISFPSLGPSEIIYMCGGKLFLYQISNDKITEVKVNLISDQAALKPSIENVEKLVYNLHVGPDGNRTLVEARGDIFSLPAEHGFVKNLTQSCGIAERFPAYSPDGKSMAYWSDASGEYELWIKNMENLHEAAKKITNYGPGFRYRMFWSPDSKKLAFIDKAMKIKIVEVSTGNSMDVDNGLSMSHGPLSGFMASWSPDSRWLTYSRDLENFHSAVFLYDVQNKKRTQVTNGYYDCGNPVFDSEGKYIYLLTSQYFQPTYSDIDNTFIYANSTQIASISLAKNTPSLIAPRNEMVGVTIIDSAETEKQKVKLPEKDKKDDKKTKIASVNIDIQDIESRLIILPPKPGNYFNISSVKGKIIYQKFPNSGADSEQKSSINFYDIEKREDKIILDDVQGYQLTANGNKMLVVKSGAFAIIKPEENQKFEKPLRVAEMEMTVEPMKEWKQIFMDAWRFERDFFYDIDMHGVNWNQVKTQYLKILESATTREELNFVLGEMIGELNASHTYRGGGDEDQIKRKNVGYLGVNWEADGDYYKIKKIIKAASWDAEVRSPFDAPGLLIKEGDYILAVNGEAINTKQEVAAYFQGLAGKTVEISYNVKPNWKDAKTVVVQCLPDESRLRHLAWIESNRKRVEEATNGESGYIYVRSTGVDGQNELIRQFNAQWNKKALIIDERFNNGGQIPDRFIEMLDRDPLAFWAIRDGKTWPWPPYAHFGPKVMLINGWSGSGGDAFPDYFRKKKLGPLIGARTWGGLIGISGVPPLIDGGGVTVPTFRMYNPDGSWFKEGHGVDPDIEVQEDLGAFSKGIDVQLERGITEIKDLLKKKAYTIPVRPPAEIR